LLYAGFERLDVSYWQLSATHDGKPFHRAMMAVYNFEQGRITEDWGIPAQGEWPDSAAATAPPEYL
jgi:hypothetical protein